MGQIVIQGGELGIQYGFSGQFSNSTGPGGIEIKTTPNPNGEIPMKKPGGATSTKSTPIGGGSSVIDDTKKLAEKTIKEASDLLTNKEKLPPVALNDKGKITINEAPEQPSVLKIVGLTVIGIGAFIGVIYLFKQIGK